jgi:hypothetical protein
LVTLTEPRGPHPAQHSEGEKGRKRTFALRNSLEII